LSHVLNDTSFRRYSTTGPRSYASGVCSYLLAGTGGARAVTRAFALAGTATTRTAVRFAHVHAIEVAVAL